MERKAEFPNGEEGGDGGTCSLGTLSPRRLRFPVGLYRPDVALAWTLAGR